MGIGDWFRRLGRRPEPKASVGPAEVAPTSAAPSSPQANPDQDSALDAAEEAALQATCEARDRYWGGIGAVEPDVISYLISPQFTGGPRWPSTRQAFRVIRTSTSVILATDGMADPFAGVSGYGNGFEMELFIDTRHIPTELAGRPGDVDPLKRSWAFVLLENTARIVADAGGVMDQLDQYGVLSIEHPGVSRDDRVAGQVPERFVLDDAVGMLLGGPSPHHPTTLKDTPLSPVRIVPIVILTAAELAHIRAGGGAARREVVERLTARPDGHMSDLERESVV